MSEQREHLEEAARQILLAFGKTEEPFLQRTPERFANYFLEENGEDPETVLKAAIIEGKDYKGTVVETGLTFHSLCEHHLLPFFGTADIAYIPNGKKLVGLSKIPRLLRLIATGPSMQEIIAQRVSDVLQEVLDPKGVAVVLKATHMCMVARGVRAEGSITITSVMTGVFLEMGSTARLEFLSLIGGKI